MSARVRLADEATARDYRPSGRRGEPSRAYPEPVSYPDAPQAPPARVPVAARRSGGAEGNERLTAITGAVLLVLLAVEGYTIPRIGRLLTLHVFLGMLLLGPVTLKAGSVLYRFARYYTGSEPYRRSSAAVAPGWPCWSPRSWPAW